ncbi:hypothetical protein LWI29_033503 [Acer saccharum]|uniref:C-JID domain-containing protein n=1 Tax=Acer saccharum TaxID=4024 RepID=A0AA39SIK3_ACESA|nr:hypothetical protein LWI29_033503 [Acer saccharum]
MAASSSSASGNKRRATDDESSLSSSKRQNLSSPASASGGSSRWKYDVFLSFRALERAANIVGDFISGGRSEAKLVEDIVNDICGKLHISSFDGDQRLWLSKDVQHVLTSNTGTDEVIGIMLNKPKQQLQWNGNTGMDEVIGIMLNKHKQRLQLNGKSFSGMSNLMLLKLSNVDISEDQIYLSNNLRFLKWHEFPLKTLPSNFQAQNLFELNLCGSQINHLWKGMKDFPKLKTIKLSNSHNLIETPDFTMVPNLEMLDLKGCTRLRKVHESVGVLKSLIVLNLEGCNSLQSFPSNLFGLKSLKNLNLQGLSCLKILNLSECNLLEGTLPKDLGSLCSLEQLYLSKNKFISLPESIKQLSKLKILCLEECERLRSLPELPSNTVFVGAEGCHSLEDVSVRGCTSPDIALYLFNCPKLIQNGGHQENNLAVMLLKQRLQKWGNRLSNQCHISIQGNEIPEWFSCRSDDNLVKIGLPPNWLNDEFMGITMCGVFTLDHKDLDGREIAVSCRMNIMGNSYGFYCAPYSFTALESDYLWLAYLSREQFEHDRSLTLLSSHLLSHLRPTEYEYDSTNSVLVSTSTCIHAQFEVTSTRGGRLNSKANKSGIRLVYKRDIECSEDDLPAIDASILHQYRNCSTFGAKTSKFYTSIFRKNYN